jgi:hypothetical protein
MGHGERATGTISLEYHGGPAALGRLDSYDVAAYIIAFSDILGGASRYMYGEKVEVKTEIQGIRGDSLDIDMAFAIAGALTTAFSAVPSSPKDVVEFVHASVKLLLFLKGKPPAAVTAIDGNSNQMQVTNCENVTRYENCNVTNYILREDTRRAAQKCFRHPIEQGIEAVSITKGPGEDPLITIGPEDAGAFNVIEQDVVVSENTLRKRLMIKSPDYDLHSKWRFYDGDKVLWATIADEGFLGEIEARRRLIAYGDMFDVEMIERQIGSPVPNKTETVITKVIRVIPFSESPKLL